MSNLHIIKWKAPEYSHKEQDLDWFWGLGVLIISSALASILFKNYFFAFLLILGGFLLGYFTYRKPRIINFELNHKGVKIDNRIYLYEDIKSYYIQTEEKSLLFIKSQRPIAPILVIPIETGHSEAIKNIMIHKKITEEKMEEGIIEKILEHLGFQ